MERRALVLDGPRPSQCPSLACAFGVCVCVCVFWWCVTSLVPRNRRSSIEGAGLGRIAVFGDSNCVDDAGGDRGDCWWLLDRFMACVAARVRARRRVLSELSRRRFAADGVVPVDVFPAASVLDEPLAMPLSERGGCAQRPSRQRASLRMLNARVWCIRRFACCAPRLCSVLACSAQWRGCGGDVRGCVRGRVAIRGARYARACCRGRARQQHGRCRA